MRNNNVQILLLMVFYKNKCIQLSQQELKNKELLKLLKKKKNPLLNLENGQELIEPIIIKEY